MTFDIPIPVSLEVVAKVAAAEAAQDTATKAQTVADEYLAAATAATEDPAPPGAHTTRIAVRNSTQGLLEQLKKINSSL